MIIVNDKSNYENLTDNLPNFKFMVTSVFHLLATKKKNCRNYNTNQ